MGKDDEAITELAKTTLRAVRAMDKECPTGLCDFVSASPFTGKLRKNEAALAWGVTEHLKKRYKVDQSERSYTGSRKRCDRVVEIASGVTVWLEMKHAWRQWFY